ncbi:MAG: hypothetical protein IPM66_10135 [Acidobacteriota bacterium]|nr:MAG: hypothetical protein IPM66_10135 [Acidobacteriota bacterium]
MKPPNKRPTITAAEIGDFAFCEKAWFLKREGHEPEGQWLMEGEDFHRTKDSLVEHSLLLRRAGWFCAGAAVLCLAGLVMLGLLLSALR